MFTKEEKQVAQQIVSNKDFVQLLAKVFLDTEEKISSETVNGKTNEELGEIVRANTLAEEKVQLRFSRLKQLGVDVGDKKNHAVPK